MPKVIQFNNKDLSPSLSIVGQVFPCSGRSESTNYQCNAKVKCFYSPKRESAYFKVTAGYKHVFDCDWCSRKIINKDAKILVKFPPTKSVKNDDTEKGERMNTKAKNDQKFRRINNAKQMYNAAKETDNWIEKVKENLKTNYKFIHNGSDFKGLDKNGVSLIKAKVWSDRNDDDLRYFYIKAKLDDGYDFQIYTKPDYNAKLCAFFMENGLSGKDVYIIVENKYIENTTRNQYYDYCVNIVDSEYIRVWFDA